MAATIQNALDYRTAISRTKAIDDLLKSRGGEVMSAAAVAAHTVMGLNPLVVGLPGGASLPAEQHVTELFPHLEYILVKNEGPGPAIVSGYGLSTGVPAFFMGTSGPGIVQALVGIYDGNMEFAPGVSISGNVFLGPLRNDKARVFQKARIVEAAKPLSKDAILADDPQKLQDIIISAFYRSMEHPQGHILVDIPKDVQISEARFRYFEPLSTPPAYFGDAAPLYLHRLVEALNHAKRPFVVLGRGALHARNDVWDFIESLGLPFAYTLKGKRVLPDDHPQSHGLMGQHGKEALNKTLAESDLVIVFGANCDDRAFLSPGNSIRGDLAVINPYLENAKARLDINYPIDADIRIALPMLMQMIHSSDDSVSRQFKARLEGWNRHIRQRSDSEQFYNEPELNMSPVNLAQAVSRHFGPHTVVYDIGEHQMHFANHDEAMLGYDRSKLYATTPLEDRLKFDKRIITSGTAGTMATSIPYAAGIKLARPKEQVLVVIGDGGFEMHMETMWVLADNDLDIPVIIVNNGQYGQVNSWFRDMHGNQVKHAQIRKMRAGPYGTKMIPDFEGVAMTYNLPFRRVENKSDLDRTLEEFAGMKGPRILDARVAELGAYPMIPTGQTYDQIIRKPRNR